MTTIPRLYCQVRSRPGAAEFDFPPAGQARWWGAEPKAETVTLADGGLTYDMAYDADGNLGLVLGVRSGDSVTAVGLDIPDIVEMVSWFSDVLCRHDAIGRSLGTHRPTGAIEAVEKIARRLGDVSAETAIRARRDVMLREMAEEACKQAIENLRAYALEARAAAITEVREDVKALARAAAEPDQAKREELLEAHMDLVNEALRIGVSRIETSLDRIEKKLRATVRRNAV